MATRKVQTGLRLKEATYEKIKELSKREHRSFNNLVEVLIEKYIETYETQNGPVFPPDEP